MGIIDTIKKRKPTPSVAPDATPVEVAPTPKKRAAKKTETLSAPKGKVVANGIAHTVLLSPIVSEKSTVQEVSHAYTFLVAKNANKTQIRRAIEEVYGIKPLKIRTILVEGKVTGFGRRAGRRNAYKKAIVTTKKDQKLAIHEGV